MAPLATCPVRVVTLARSSLRAGEGPALLLDETDRTHLDLHVASEEKQRAEVERLISLGARRVDWAYPDSAHFVVLSDTEGNLFCVVNTEGGQRL